MVVAFITITRAAAPSTFLGSTPEAVPVVEERRTPATAVPVPAAPSAPATISTSTIRLGAKRWVRRGGACAQRPSVSRSTPGTIGLDSYLEITVAEISAGRRSPGAGRWPAPPKAVSFTVAPVPVTLPTTVVPERWRVISSVSEVSVAAAISAVIAPAPAAAAAPSSEVAREAAAWAAGRVQVGLWGARGLASCQGLAEVVPVGLEGGGVCSRFGRGSSAVSVAVLRSAVGESVRGSVPGGSRAAVVVAGIVSGPMVILSMVDIIWVHVCTQGWRSRGSRATVKDPTRAIVVRSHVLRGVLPCKTERVAMQEKVESASTEAAGDGLHTKGLGGRRGPGLDAKRHEGHGRVAPRQARPGEQKQKLATAGRVGLFGGEGER